MQLIGRLYHFGMSESPLVIDMYNSAKLFLKNEHIKSENGYVNMDRSIRDIINPICGDYNVIDFINDYLAITIKRYLLEEDYRGIKAGVYSFSRLCTLCGVNHKSFRVFASSKGIKKFSAKLIIDYCFDIHKHHEQCSNTDYIVLKEQYRGIEPCTTLVELSRSLGIPYRRLNYVVQKYIGKAGIIKCIDFKDIIDYVLGDKEFVTKEQRYVLNIEYKGIKPCMGVKQIEEQCGVRYHTGFDYIKRMKKNGVSVDVYSLIDYMLSLKTKGAVCRGINLFIEKEYRGISPFKSVSGLEKQLNCPTKAVSYVLGKIKFNSTEGLIDYMLDVYIPSHNVTYHSNDI